MSRAGPGLSPNKQAASGKVAISKSAGKVFAKGGVKTERQTKAPSLKPGQTPKTTGK